MNDLEFMIVNSNLPHAKTVLHELEKRVTFKVYQDTVEKNIWELMEGGKDDIYVYDRCGRLAYYIPYPLSIMNSDEALVVSAILATYYRSPCGVTCDKNNNSSLEDILNAKETTEQSFSTIAMAYSEEPTYGNEISASDLQPENENTLSNENKTSEHQKSQENNDVLNKIEDVDYPLFNDTMDDFEYNETEAVFTDTFYNSLQNVLLNNGTLNIQIEDLNFTLPINNSTDKILANSTLDGEFASNDTQTPLHRHNQETEAIGKPSVPPTKRKSDRCIEADISVCKNWSKKRLIRAHNCCSVSEELRDAQMCKNFGKKRCKKLRTILKCCIKTTFVENPPTTAINESDPMGANENITTTTMSDKAEEVVSTAVGGVNNDTVCCRNLPKGKLCRVVESPHCGEGEYIADNVDRSEVTPSDLTK